MSLIANHISDNSQHINSPKVSDFVNKQVKSIFDNTSVDKINIVSSKERSRNTFAVPKTRPDSKKKLTTDVSLYSLQAEIRKHLSSQSYSEELKALLAPILELEVKNIDEKAMLDSLDLLLKRLKEAVEVDFKAYLPAKPTLYRDWKVRPENQSKTPIDCLRENYTLAVQHNAVFQDTLSGKHGLDPQLGKAVKNYCEKNNFALSDILPSKPARFDRLAAQISPDKVTLLKSIYNKIKN